MEVKHFVDIEIVKQLMKEKGIDEKKLAELTRVTLPTVKRFLKGANQWNMSLIFPFKIANVLEVNITTIIKND